MKNKIPSFFVRTNISEKGFIVNLPSLNLNEHLTIGFDKKRNNFNIHFTKDASLPKHEKRHNFILVLSSFRFLLLLKRLETFQNSLIPAFLQKIKANPFDFSDKSYCFMRELTEKEQKTLLTFKKKRSYFKLKKMPGPEFIDFFMDHSEISQYKNGFFTVFYLKNDQLQHKGFLFKFEKFTDFYFVTPVMLEELGLRLLIYLYNYLNTYPDLNTLKFRKILYNRLNNIESTLS
ncbi:MAG TPA: hypothetical protein VFM82_06895 [Flavobacteriaceae bacterium]|nr:hypothetical protein [Flavobacteriaceae bacterium]